MYKDVKDCFYSFYHREVALLANPHAAGRLLVR
jgi:hypothetical protein